MPDLFAYALMRISCPAAEYVSPADHEHSQVLADETGFQFDTGKISDIGSAAAVAQYLQRKINELQKSLGKEGDIAIELESSGNRIAFAIDEIEVENPDKILFRGHFPDGSGVRVFQHFKQLDFRLTTIGQSRTEQNLESTLSFVPN
jgi:hypothetical protein